MPYPVGVTTRQLSFSTALDFEDSLSYNVRAVVSSNSDIVWQPTGVPLLATPQVIGASPFALPVTDQTSWVDKNGNVLSSPTHSYRIDLEAEINGEWKVFKSLSNLFLPTSGLTLDLDAAPDSSIRTVYKNA